jgi:hypothetical protein
LPLSREKVSANGFGDSRRHHFARKAVTVELIVLVLVPLPLGFFVHKRTAAFISYIAVQAFVFTFQSLNLLIEWVGGSTEAFGPYPHADKTEVFSYGAVNLVIYGVGLGLVVAGQRLARRRILKSGQDPT